MAMIEVAEADDPRLDPYRTVGAVVPDGEHMVAEGGTVVARLLASGGAVVSLLVERSRLPRAASWPLGDVPVYVVTAAVLEALMGRGYKSGLYARARRAPLPALGPFLGALPPGARTVLALPNLTTPRNVGAIARVVAGLGGDGLLVGESTADPLGRLAVRASMGTVFGLPMARLGAPGQAMATLSAAGFHRVAVTLAPGAERLPVLRRRGCRAERVALVLGHETEGLSSPWEAACDARVTLPMARGVDSLNVATAAAIFLYEYLQLPSE